ncbi:MAG: DUF72 domain-containing protein [Verrucomicrobiae bacterium]|nr:DUF72 domain-containing protein [Verrucomicrobiae bacterium]
MAVLVGTSGWSYKAWAKTFYPDGVTGTGELGYYVQNFPTVEINASFYRLPFKNMVSGWYDRSPPDFLFAVKGSRLITHYKRLAGIAHPLKKFLTRVGGLKEKLGPILWQLPPHQAKDLPRLEKFLARLQKESPKQRHAVEFRHRSWMEDKKTFELLREHGAAIVHLSSQRMPMDLRTTADFVYMRFHGLEGGAAHDYTPDELRPWAEFFRAQSKKGRDVFVYFNNDINTRAPQNAQILIQLVGDRAVSKLKLAQAA